uniref:uncharacterized protein LOC120344486 n=1 Tax=Styela clava TaxID=7725 RepID=UPI00193A9513|nr:uncharacterized protein LOC120344486 [Styela clava]
MDAAKLFSDCNDDFSQAPSDSCPGPSARSLSQTENITISNLEEEIVIQDDSESAKENSKQYNSNENKVSQSWILSSCRSNEKESQSSSGANNSQVIRCLQESLTVVSGEAMPLEISDLQNVIEYEVPVNTSKYFRVRANVESCKPNNGTTVVHCCPITGIAFPTTNTGKPLNFTGDVQAFVKIWRKVRGLDSQNTESSCSIIGMDSQSASQWDLPTSQGTNPVKIREYDCQKDGSRWESVEAEKFVVRKRKLNGKTFKILYLLKVEDYGTDRLIQHSSKYDRVIQTVPLSLMLSTSPPAVGIQHGVFYYSCPAYAIPPCLPTLKEEAESFIESRISSTMNCPTLVPRFSLNLTLADGKVKLENVTLASNKAAEFFCCTTPQDYLLNINKVADSIDECINEMVNGPTLLECIIEKKSRKRSNTEDAKPYYIYDICNTSLRC